MLRAYAKNTQPEAWPFDRRTLRGVDAAIDYPGRPGVYGMADSHKTMERFKAAFDTPSAVSLRDIPALWSLPDGGGSYLFRRYAVALRARLPFRGGREARARYVSRETDLRRLSFRFSAKVAFHMDDGRCLTHEVELPRGFAGDPDRISVPPAKLMRDQPVEDPVVLDDQDLSTGGLRAIRQVASPPRWAASP